MKRSNDGINLEETKRKEIKFTTCQVMIILDETIGSRLLYRKFKYQTSELQLFLQHVPVLGWYPHEIIGTVNNIDACIFNAVMRNPIHNFSVVKVVKHMLCSNLFHSEPYLKIDEIIEPRMQNAAKLLKGLLDDELFILQALGEYKKGEGYTNPIKFASNRLKDDEQFLLKVIKMNNDSVKYASDRLRNTEQFIPLANEQYSDETSLEYDSSPNDSSGINYEQKYFSKTYSSLKDCSNNIRDDEQAVLNAVKHNYSDLRYASDRLKNNEEIVLEAVKKNGNAFEYASERLKNNEEFVLEVVKCFGYAFEYASERLKNNEEIVLRVVKTNGDALDYTSDRLKDNEKIVLEAVKQNSDALYYASERLRNDFNFASVIFKCCDTFDIFKHFGEKLCTIEFINHYIETYQSKFH